MNIFPPPYDFISTSASSAACD